MSRFKDFWELTKPKVVILMLVTAWVGMVLASSKPLSLWLVAIALLGIACCAGSGAVLNHWADEKIDEHMARTANRPVVSGRVKPIEALLFSLILMVIGALILWFWVNPLTAMLSVAAMVGYAIIYTFFLKHTTPQNIVIGGLAGAMPPALGWVAVTGELHPHAWLLVLIIYAWTPPHFWALAIHREKDYAKAKVPMLPVTHGVEYTKLHLLLYTWLLVASTYLPFVTGMSGFVYMLGVTPLNVIYLWWVHGFYRDKSRRMAMPLFGFSIVYLFLVFILLISDHVWWQI